MTEGAKPIDMQGFTLTRVLDAPRDLVWRAWTEPGQTARWLHPRGATTPREDVRVDLRVGGRYRYVLVGEVEQYEDGHRLCYVRGPEGVIVELVEQIG